MISKALLPPADRQAH